jgi:hypothetical protein
VNRIYLWFTDDHPDREPVRLLIGVDSRQFTRTGVRRELGHVINRAAVVQNPLQSSVLSQGSTADWLTVTPDTVVVTDSILG